MSISDKVEVNNDYGLTLRYQSQHFWENRIDVTTSNFFYYLFHDTSSIFTKKKLKVIGRWKIIGGVFSDYSLGLVDVLCENLGPFFDFCDNHEMSPEVYFYKNTIELFWEPSDAIETRGLLFKNPRLSVQQEKIIEMFENIVAEIENINFQ